MRLFNTAISLSLLICLAGCLEPASGVAETAQERCARMSQGAQLSTPQCRALMSPDEFQSAAQARDARVAEQARPTVAFDCSDPRLTNYQKRQANCHRTPMMTRSTALSTARSTTRHNSARRDALQRADDCFEQMRANYQVCVAGSGGYGVQGGQKA